MILLPSALAGELRLALAAAYPNEGCGLLVGRRQDDRVEVTALAPSANLAPDPAHRFEIDPALRLRLQRELRGSGEDIVGLYHSHPDGAAAPSDTDARMAWEPELIWLIAAVRADGVAALRAWRLADGGGRFTEIALAHAAPAAPGGATEKDPTAP